MLPKRKKITRSYLQLPDFLPARNGIGWVPANSSQVRQDNQLSRQQEATRLNCCCYYEGPREIINYKTIN